MFTVFIVFIFLILLVIIVLICHDANEWRRNRALLRTVTNTRRGTRSERKLILNLLKHNIPAITIFHDLYVERTEGQYSQIDAVVITRVGIIVFEVKEYSGWIFGKGYQNQWTQVLAYGKEKNRFYNPVLQNKGHIEALKTRLEGIADVPFFSVVIFYGKCLLRNISNIPYGTYVDYASATGDIISDIMKNNPPANYNDKLGVINTLKEAVANGENKAIINRHIQNVRSIKNLRITG